MAIKLFVGSLPYSTTDDELKEIFAPFGDVASAKVIFDRETGRSKGFGFVEFDDDDAAKTAIKELDGSEFGGRSLVVNEARPKEDRGERRSFDNKPRGGRMY